MSAAGARVEFRPASAGDLAWIRRCIEDAYALYVPRIGRRPAPMDADYAALIAAGEVHIAERGGQPAGLIVAQAEADHLFVETIAVAPALQGTGLGRAIMDFAEAEARRRHLQAVLLYTNAAMTENLVFYPHLGYRETGRRVEHGFNRVYYEKILP